MHFISLFHMTAMFRFARRYSNALRVALRMVSNWYRTSQKRGRHQLLQLTTNACLKHYSLFYWAIRPTYSYTGHILSRIYNCTIHGNRPIDNTTSAHLHFTFEFYNCTNCDQLHLKICLAHILYIYKDWV